MKYIVSFCFVSLIHWIPLIAADVIHPILWERSFDVNVSDSTSTAKINQSTSYMVTSQDFQGVIVGSSIDDPPERVVLNFGESCLSSNTTLQSLQELNSNTIQTKMIQGAEKLALVKRGNCSWSEKVSVVANLSLLNNINVTAVFIYDNQSYGDNIVINRIPVSGSGAVDVPQFSTPLPASRSILNMSDNDLLASNYVSPVQAIYFIPNVYGETFVDRINTMTDPINPTIKDFWLLTPYLTTVSWGQSGPASYFFSFDTSYIAYIVSFVGVLIIMVIAFRWWSKRQARDASNNNVEGGITLRRIKNKLDPLPVELVNKLPIDTYSEGLIKNENCAICLEDFKPGKDDVRLLPCGHGFCVLCIDPWLTQKSCLCPICKWDCLPIDLRKEREMQKRQNEQFEQLEATEDTQLDTNNEPESSSARNSHIVEVHNTDVTSAPVTVTHDAVNVAESTDNNNSPDVVISIPDEPNKESLSSNSRGSTSETSHQKSPEFTAIDLSSNDNKKEEK